MTLAVARASSLECSCSFLERISSSLDRMMACKRISCDRSASSLISASACSLATSACSLATSAVACSSFSPINRACSIPRMACACASKNARRNCVSSEKSAPYSLGGSRRASCPCFCCFSKCTSPSLNPSSSLITCRILRAGIAQPHCCTTRGYNSSAFTDDDVRCISVMSWALAARLLMMAMTI